MIPRHHAKPPMTRKRALAALTQLLYFCTPERLKSFTAASLSGSYNVPPAAVERALAEARRKRL